MKIKLYPPVRKIFKLTGFGRLNSIQEFRDSFKLGGQTFFGNGVPACVFIKDAPCNISIYQYNGKKSHGALDIILISGDPIYAAHDGIVVELQEDKGSGLGITLFDPIQKIKTLYWHNKAHVVGMNREVKAGELIAYGDTTGRATGAHLHFAVKYTNDKGETIKKDNGWQGAFDPLGSEVEWLWFETMNEFWRADKDVYLIKDGKKHLIVDGPTFQIFSGDWGGIKKVEQSELDVLPDGYLIIAHLNI